MAPETLVMSLQNGDLFSLNLISDGLISVRGFHLYKAAIAVMTCCVVQCDYGYLFPGFRLANSQLFRYSIKTSPIVRLDNVKKEEIALSSNENSVDVAPLPKKKQGKFKFC